ncbi:alkaline-phosphatase-like protein [Melanogaster broomeanus]|nr:alkaline-phosphatase-like protein [Melanogaster broomeanus]
MASYVAPPGDEARDDEERRALLSNVDGDVEVHPKLLNSTSSPPSSKSPLTRNWKLLASLSALVLLGLGGAAYFRMCVSHKPARQRGELFSNGTHEYKRTVVLISIDGLRADYLDRGLTPHLLDISKQGIRAKYMKPVFPTLTFPHAHRSTPRPLLQNFWDPATDTEFWYNRNEIAWNATWWFGEPMWETAERAGAVTANLMWPAEPPYSGASSTYYIPWRDKVPLQEKLDQILEWIDIEDVDERPELILAYEPSLDQAGHSTGPMSALVNETLSTIDTFARDLHNSLLSRNLSQIVDVIFVSDHGMGDTSAVEWIYIDGENILGDTWENVTHYDGWPSMGLRFTEETDQRIVLETLVRASNDPEFSGKFEVYTTDSYAGGRLAEATPMPLRYHFSSNERIAPIWIVPTLGYALTTKWMGEEGMSTGNHGYDNDEPSMRAIFVAHGPFSHGAKALSSNPASTQTQPPTWHSVKDDAYVMPGFDNVEVYNLVMRLLDIERWAAPTNGTAGFWDAYVDL